MVDAIANFQIPGYWKPRRLLYMENYSQFIMDSLIKGKLYTFEIKEIDKAPSIISSVVSTKAEGAVRACVKSSATFHEHTMKEDKRQFVNVTRNNSFVMVRTNQGMLLFQHKQDNIFKLGYVLDMTVSRGKVVGSAFISKTELSAHRRWTLSVYNMT